MSAITTHILDTHRGVPAFDVPVQLFRKEGGDFTLLASGRTDDDGRIRDLLSEPLKAGVYRMHFDTGSYHEGLGISGFYPEAVITFTVYNPNQHHHIPLLLSPFAYSTYRGS
jgi:5-hydroxyisourate hydrolase